MLRRSRNLIPIPPQFDGPSSEASLELVKAKEYYAQDPRPDKAFDFEVYGEAEVRNALMKLFNNKCAYCEIKFVRCSPHVDHYRPKGGVSQPDGSLLRPGYWRLAADWNNLFPACEYCNCWRNHVGDDGIVRGMGKQNFFPLADGQVHDFDENKHLLETPLLVNPCNDN